MTKNLDLILLKIQKFLNKLIKIIIKFYKSELLVNYSKYR